MSNKQKGSKYERELFQMFIDNNYGAVSKNLISDKIGKKSGFYN